MPDKAIDISRIKKALYSYNNRKNKEITILKVLSKIGSFSTVFEVADNNRVIIMKVVDTKNVSIGLSPSEVINYTETEIRHMEKLKGCKYVMPLLDSYKYVSSSDDVIYFLFMPKYICSSDYLNTNPSIENIFNMTRDICEALVECNKKGILHRDIKEQNIFYTGSNYVLSDFGISKSWSVNKDGTVTLIGSNYTAPEVKARKQIRDCVKADMYSLALMATTLIAENDTGRNTSYGKKKELLKILEKASQTNPDNRYRSYQDFYRKLNSLNATRPDSTVIVGRNVTPKITLCLAYKAAIAFVLAFFLAYYARDQISYYLADIGNTFSSACKSLVRTFDQTISSLDFTSSEPQITAPVNDSVYLNTEDINAKTIDADILFCESSDEVNSLHYYLSADNPALVDIHKDVDHSGNTSITFEWEYRIYTWLVEMQTSPFTNEQIEFYLTSKIYKPNDTTLTMAYPNGDVRELNILPDSNGVVHTPIIHWDLGKLFTGNHYYALFFNIDTNGNHLSYITVDF